MALLKNVSKDYIMDLDTIINNRAKEIENSYSIDVEAIAIDVEENENGIYVSWAILDNSIYDVTKAQIRNFDEKIL